MVAKPNPNPRNPGRAALLALSVASGETLRGAAKRLGIPIGTAKRWAASERFKTRVEELRADMISATVGQLASRAAGAVETLGKLMDTSESESIQLSAARAILDRLGPVIEFADLAKRLERLESGAQHQERDPWAAR